MIKAAHYYENEQRMAKDPDVIQMFEELPEAMKAQLRNGDFISGFGIGSLNEYKRRTGKSSNAHIGVIHGALIIIAKEQAS